VTRPRKSSIFTNFNLNIMKKYAIILALFLLTAGFSQASGTLHLRLDDQNHLSSDYYNVDVILYYNGSPVATPYSIYYLSVAYSNQDITLAGVPYDINQNLYYYSVKVYKNGSGTAIYQGYVAPGLFNTAYWFANDFSKTCSF
jgi:hypothetical protein